MMRPRNDWDVAFVSRGAGFKTIQHAGLGSCPCRLELKVDPGALLPGNPSPVLDIVEKSSVVPVVGPPGSDDLRIPSSTATPASSRGPRL